MIFDCSYIFWGIEMIVFKKLIIFLHQFYEAILFHAEKLM